MKSTAAADAAWYVVSTTDPAALDREGIVEFLRSVSAVRAVCDAVEVRAVRRTRQLSLQGTSEPAENLLANRTGRSSKNARQAATREEACAAMPLLEAGLADGTVSAGHLDAAAAAHAKLDDDVAEQFAAHASELAARSQQLGVDAFERECRDLARHLTAINDANAETDELDRQRAASSVKRWVDRATGMHKTLISLDPLRDSKMWKVITNQVARERQQRTANGAPPLPFTALQAQAVVTAITNTPTPTPSSTPTRAPAPSPTPTSTRAPAPSATPASATTRSPAPRTAKSPNTPTNNTPPPTTPTTTPDTPPHEAPATIPTPDTASTRPPAPPQGAAPFPNSPSPNDHNATGFVPASPTSGAALRLPEISILCDLDTLITGIRTTITTCETDDGTPIPPATVRRLACDAKIIPILLGTNGEVLDQGRQARTATAAQRNTLAAMHQSCAFPGCTIGFSDCRIHHVRWWWEQHGRTDIGNLLPLCEKHHHYVHEGGWALTLDADRTATWSLPDGSTHHQGTTMNRRPRELRLHPARALRSAAVPRHLSTQVP